MSPGAERCADCGASLATEYTSEPFTDFLVPDDGEAGDDHTPAAPAEPSAAPAEPSAAASLTAGAAGSAASERRRSRMLAVVLGAAVIIAAGMVGGLALLGHRNGQQAQASPSRAAAPTASASVSPATAAPASPTASASASPTAAPTLAPAPAPAVVPAQPAAATPSEQRAAPGGGSAERFAALMAALQQLLRDRQLGGHGPGGGPWPGIHHGAAPHAGGLLGGLRRH